MQIQLNGARGEARRFGLTKIRIVEIALAVGLTIAALLFVCQQALAGGVTTSLVMDTHGKTLSYALLEMEITI